MAGLLVMRVTASYFFCVAVMGALSVALAVGEEPDISAAADSPWTKFEQLKQGQMLVLEAVSRDDTPHIVMISLVGFFAVYDGPPTPMPAMQERILSESEMDALREQDKRAKEERRRRCGSSP